MTDPERRNSQAHRKPMGTATMACQGLRWYRAKIRLEATIAVRVE